MVDFLKVKFSKPFVCFRNCFVDMGGEGELSHFHCCDQTLEHVNLEEKGFYFGLVSENSVMAAGSEAESS